MRQADETKNKNIYEDDEEVFVQIDWFAGFVPGESAKEARLY